MQNKAKKKEKKGIKWFKDNKRELIFLAIGVVVGILIMAAFWPERIAELDNGEEVIVEVEGKQFTASDLYDEMKGDYGISELMDLVDIYILKEMYDLEDEADDYAKEQADYIFELYETNYGYTEEEFLSYNGFDSKDALYDYLREEYYYQKYYYDYVASTISDDEVKTFYDESVFGTKEIYLFSSSEEDNDLESVRKYLKKGKTYDEITTKFSDITASDLEDITYESTDSYTDEMLEVIANTEEGSYSEVFEDDNYGYAVIYVVSAEEKGEYDDMKDDILEYLVSEKQNEDSNLYYQAFINLRNDYGIKFYDDVLEKAYKESIADYE